MFPPTIIRFQALLALPIAAKSLADIRDVQPDGIVERATPTLTASVVATPTLGEYFGPVVVDGQTYSVLYDTGSNALWIKKNGSIPSGPQSSITYGSGQVNVTVTSGTVTIAGLTTNNQTFGVATSWDSAYEKYDGILGLGLSRTSWGGYTSWQANAMPQYKQPLFGVNIPPSGSGTFTFGYHDTAHENGPLSYNTANYSSSTWYAKVTSFNIPANDTTMNCNPDSGTTNILVPPSVAYGFWSQVPNATAVDGGERWTFHCTNSATVPNFSVTIGGVKYTVAAADLYYRNTPSTGLCGSRLQGRKNGNYCILGQPFFYSNYIAYNYNEKLIGLAGRK